jgi:toxin CcdB
MAQFDVHRLAGDDSLVIDCQSDLLNHLDGRLVVPLMRRRESPSPMRRLNPIFQIEGTEYVMRTQAAAAIRRDRLGPVVCSLAERNIEIVGALDVLITGV